MSEFYIYCMKGKGGYEPFKGKVIGKCIINEGYLVNESGCKEIRMDDILMRSGMNFYDFTAYTVKHKRSYLLHIESPDFLGTPLDISEFNSDLITPMKTGPKGFGNAMIVQRTTKEIMLPTHDGKTQKTEASCLSKEDVRMISVPARIIGSVMSKKIDLLLEWAYPKDIKIKG
jgi:hypothetical protein